jgi:hypothetical protein
VKSQPESVVHLANDVMSAVRRVDVTQDVRGGTYTMQVDGGEFAAFGVALHQNADRTLFA